MKEIPQYFEYRGRWWFPSDPEKKYFGVLIKDSSGIHLTLEEYDISFQNMMNKGDVMKNIPIILGTTVTNDIITLSNCREVRFNNNTSFVNKSSSRTTEYVIDMALFGVHFNNYNDIQFNKVYVSYCYLDEWLNMFFVRSKMSRKGNIIRYKVPQKIKFGVNSDLDITLYYNINSSGRSIYQKEYKISQKAYVEFNFKKHQSWEYCWKQIRLFQDFLVFATQKNVQPDLIYGHNENHKKSISNTQIYDDIVIVRHDSLYKDTAEVSPFDFLFHFQNISSKRTAVVRKWYSLYERLEPQIQLYTIRYYNPKMYLEYHFLSLVQSLEGLHRALFKGTYVTKKHYESIRKKLTAAIPESTNLELKTVLMSKISLGYEYSLKKRLTDIISKIPPSIRSKLFTNAELFCKKVKDTRNYLAHQEEGLRKNAVTGGGLYSLTIKLQIILEVLLMKQLNLKEKIIEAIIDHKLSRYNISALKKDD